MVRATRTTQPRLLVLRSVLAWGKGYGWAHRCAHVHCRSALDHGGRVAAAGGHDGPGRVRKGALQQGRVLHRARAHGRGRTYVPTSPLALVRRAFERPAQRSHRPCVANASRVPAGARPPARPRPRLCAHVATRKGLAQRDPVSCPCKCSHTWALVITRCVGADPHRAEKGWLRDAHVRRRDQRRGCAQAGARRYVCVFPPDPDAAR